MYDFIWRKGLLWTQRLCLPKIHVEILTPKVMVFGAGTFGRYIGNEGEALMNGICALKKGTSESSLALFHHVRIK